MTGYVTMIFRVVSARSLVDLLVALCSRREVNGEVEKEAGLFAGARLLSQLRLARLLTALWAELFDHLTP
jgi:hypothetical protein